MQCPECGCQNPDHANYCNRCGCKLSADASVRAEVISFNEKLEKLQRYLPRGISQKILDHKEKLEGERRQVTVMFCDMEGFTPLVDRLATEEAYRMMDKIYEILIHSVHAFDGTVNEMTGDGIVALFGAPVALEDAPQRALRSAIAIHRNIAEFNAQNPDVGTIRMRIGIHTGLVIVGTLGNDRRVEFKAVGDTVNLAARIEKLAAPGTTCVTEETYKQTNELFQFEMVGKRAVKGKKDLIRVYKLLAAKKEAYRTRLGSERLIYSAMIGRRKELERLELQLIKLVNGQGAIVNIVGEAGIGKSRLVAELKKRELMKRVWLLEGRAISIGRNLSFHPIIDILRRWAGITPEDREIIAIEKLKAALKNLYPEEFAKRLPFVASLMGLKLLGDDAEQVKGIKGESLEKLILENVRELLVRVAASRPLVILIEDLHWSDTSSIELLETLLGLTQTHRILFINIFRPGFEETGDRIRDTIRERMAAAALEVRLEPLDVPRSETLIKNMLHHSVLNHTIMRQIVNRAGGNPYFIEEIVRSMIDEGALVVKDGLFQVTSKINRIKIPNTINDVLMSRIDQLEETTRDVMRIASIVGRTFLYRIVRDVATGIADIEDRLTTLCDMQLIVEDQPTGEIEYRFKHGLAQETVYLSMLPQRRRMIHLKVAESIERIFQDKLHEFYGILSYHFNHGEDFNKAEAYMVKAGDEAMKISASSEALNYYKTAMEMYIKKRGEAVDIGKIAELEENIATAFFNKGNFVEAVTYFERSLKNYGVKLRPHPRLAAAEMVYHLLRIFKGLYLPSWIAKRPPGAMDSRIMNVRFKLALSLAYVDINRVFMENLRNVPHSFKYDISNEPVYVDFLIGMSALFAVAGISFKISSKILRYVDARIFAGRPQTAVPQNFYRFIESLHNCLTGKWHPKLNPQFVDEALSVGEVSYASGYLVWLGYAKIERGDFEDAQKIIDEIFDIAHRYHFEHGKLDGFFLMSKLAVVTSALAQADGAIDDGIRLLEKLGLEMRKVEFYGLKIKILVLQNDHQAARKVIRQVDDLIQEISKKAILPNYYGEYLIGKLRYALAQLEKAITLNHRVQMKNHKKATRALIKDSARHFKRRTAVGRTEAYRLIGRYFWMIDNEMRALKWWNQSIAEGQRLDTEHELTKTLNEMEGRYRRHTT